ncbi:MAG: hypothetical protein NT007_01400 [Candidatus Kapabacteria bacterium]|nr:hypothetical protein [Candidatus Kapabacteria bacterium]
MKLKTKLSFGLGFLFLIIFSLVIFCMYYIGKISSDSENILKDNYNSVIYAKNMASAIDGMNSVLFYYNYQSADDHYGSKINHFKEFKKQFDENLALEANNITETHEKEYVDSLKMNYSGIIMVAEILEIKGAIVKVGNYDILAQNYKGSRQYIDSISNENIQAIVQKNLFAKKDAENMKTLMAIIGTFLVLLAFAYFWYFPFFVSNSISFLSDRMLALLKSKGIESEIKTKDESFILLNCIEKLEEKYK